MSANQSRMPVVPMGGFVDPDPYRRCPKCSEGGLGTILSRVDISIRHRDKPNEPVARMVRCCKCSYIQESYLIPGNKDITGKRLPSVAEINDITMAMVQKCLNQAVFDSFDMSEFKSGKVDGVIPKQNGISRTDNYNPDAYIEQETF